MPAALGDPRAAGAEWGGERERTESRQRAVRTEVTSAAGWRGERPLPLDSPPPSDGPSSVPLLGPLLASNRSTLGAPSAQSQGL